MAIGKGEVGRIARRHWQALLTEAGFQPKGSTVYWRLCDNLLQYISLEVPPGQFTVEVAIQPIFVPSDTFILAFGGRLGRFVNGVDHWVSTSSVDAVESGLLNAAEHLRHYALPWFDNLKSVRALVEWFSEGATGLGGPHGSGLFDRLPIWKGYCHAYLGDYDLAIPLIGENLPKAIRPEWPDYQPTLDLLRAMQTEPGKVDSMLKHWATQTKAKLKLS